MSYDHIKHEQRRTMWPVSITRCGTKLYILYWFRPSMYELGEPFQFLFDFYISCHAYIKTKALLVFQLDWNGGCQGVFAEFTTRSQTTLVPLVQAVYSGSETGLSLYTAISNEVDLWKAQHPFAKHCGISNFSNCWAGLDIIYQNYLVLCFAGFIRFVFRRMDGTLVKVQGSHDSFRVRFCPLQMSTSSEIAVYEI